MNVYLILLAFISLSQSFPFLPPRSQELQLRYPTGPWITPGDTLLRPETTSLPLISSSGLNCTKTYLILFLDLDALLQPTAQSTTVLHWYQPDLIPNCTEEPDLLTNRTSSGASYIAPQPPANSHHRYVYLLFEQPENYTLPDCFSYIFPATPEGRAGFNLRQFMEVAGLAMPVAANYFFVQNDGGVTASVTATTTWTRTAPCGMQTGVVQGDWMGFGQIIL